jgi:mono/diheme cytochrome c family protein
MYLVCVRELKLTKNGIDIFHEVPAARRTEMKMPYKTVAVQRTRKRALGVLFGCSLVLLGVSSFGLAQNTSSKSPAKAAMADHSSAALVARGKYIVEGLSRCGQCHTPRESNGRPDENELLEGAAVWLKPAEPVEDWPLKAPRIAGILPATDAEVVKLLTTGVWTNGKRLRQPMPQFRMTEQDAEAVVAYLKSLQ